MSKPPWRAVNCRRRMLRKDNMLNAILKQKNEMSYFHFCMVLSMTIPLSFLQFGTIVLSRESLGPTPRGGGMLPRALPRGTSVLDTLRHSGYGN